MLTIEESPSRMKATMSLIHPRHPRQVLIALAVLALPGVVALGMLIARIQAVIEPSGGLLATSGGEPISIYNVFKLQRGMKLYEDPREPPFYASTLYNAGFYHSYAAVGRMFFDGLHPPVTALRLFTLALGCAGLAGLLAYVLVLVRRAPELSFPVIRAIGMLLTGVAVVLGALPGWWLLTVRPDVGAAAFATLALLITLLIGPGRDGRAGLLAGLCLAAAWSFKQSTVFLLIGLLISALLNRRYRYAFAMMIPLVLTGVAFIALLGPEYRFNAFFATSLSQFELRNLASMAIRVPLKGAFPLVAAIAALVTLPRMSWMRRDEAVCLKTCWWTCLSGAVVTCCRGGSEVNYFFEFWVVVGFLAVNEAGWLIESAGKFPARLSPALLALSVVAISSSGLDAMRIASPGRLGTVRLKPGEDRLRELKRAQVLAEAETGVVCCQPALWGLGWDLPVPAYVFDDYPYFQEPAERRGLLRGGGLPGLLAARHFRLMILETDNLPFINAATAAGYLRELGWSHLAIMRPGDELERVTSRERSPHPPEDRGRLTR